MVGVQEKAMVDDILNYYDIRYLTFKTRTHKEQYRQDERNSVDHEGTIYECYWCYL
jgi:predicted ATP-binding protein involved in virulence